MTLVYYNNSFSVEGEDPLAGVDSHTIFEHLAWSIMTARLGEATLLLQGGVLIAPVFVIQSPPSYQHPWWQINVIQYHSVSPNLARFYYDVFGFISDKSMIAKDLDDEFRLHPYSQDHKGFIAQRHVPLRHDLAYHAQNAEQMIHKKNINSLVKSARISTDQSRAEVKELCGGKDYDLLDFDLIRDDYPTASILDLVQELEEIHTLETEMLYILGAAN